MNYYLPKSLYPKFVTGAKHQNSIIFSGYNLCYVYLLGHACTQILRLRQGTIKIMNEG